MPPPRADFREYAVFDARYGGFGIAASCVHILVVLLMVSLLLNRRLRRKFIPYFGLCLALFLGLFVLPSGWWARYVSFFALVPLVVLLFLEREGVYVWARRLLVLLLTLNTTLTTLSALDQAYTNTENTKMHIAAMKAKPTVSVNFSESAAFRHKLQENGIRYTESNTKEVELPLKGFPLFMTDAEYKSLKVENWKYRDGVWTYYKSCVKRLVKYSDKQ